MCSNVQEELLDSSLLVHGIGKSLVAIQKYKENNEKIYKEIIFRLKIEKEQDLVLTELVQHGNSRKIFGKTLKIS